MKHVDDAVIADVAPLQARLEHLVVFHRALGDGTRMRIVWTLMDGEMCVSDIARSMEMTESAISRQLRELRGAGLVKARRDKRNIFYTLNGTIPRDILLQTLEYIERKRDHE